MPRYFIEDQEGNVSYFDSKPMPLPARPRPPEVDRSRMYRAVGVLLLCLLLAPFIGCAP